MDSNPIYKFMKENGFTQKDEATFISEYSNPQKSAELHKFMVDNRFTTKSADDFYNEYFSASKKKGGTTQDSGQRGEPSAPSFGQKVTEKITNAATQVPFKTTQQSQPPAQEKKKAAPSKYFEVDITEPQDVTAEKPVVSPVEMERRQSMSMATPKKIAERETKQRADDDFYTNVASKEVFKMPTYFESKEYASDITGDYLNYLQQVDPEKGTYTNEKYKVLKAKSKEDRTATDEGFLRQVESEAVNKVYDANYERLQLLGSNIDDLEKIAVTPSDRSRLDYMYKEYEKVSDSLKGLSATYEQNNLQYGKIAGQEMQGEQDKRARFEKIQAGEGKTKEFFTAVADAAMEGILNTYQFPKVMGDLIGDKDYDWSDEFYDAMSGAKSTLDLDLGAPLPQGTSTSDLPFAARAALVGGNAIGTMGIFMLGGATGGATKLGQRAATFATSFLTQESNYYQEALDGGMSPQDAAITGSYLAAQMALFETIIPDIGYLNAAGFKKGVVSGAMQAMKSGLPAKEAAKLALKNALSALPENALIVGKNVVKSGGKEFFAEELPQNLAEDTAKEIINNRSQKAYFNDTFNPESYVDAAIGSFVAAGGTSGISSIFSKPTPKSPVQEEVMRHIVENRDKIFEKGTASDKTAGTEGKKQVDEAGEILDAMKSHSGWSQMSKEEQDHAFAVAQQAEVMKKEQERMKELRIPDERKDAEIKKLEDEVNQMFSMQMEQDKQKAKDAKIKAIEDEFNKSMEGEEFPVQEDERDQEIVELQKQREERGIKELDTFFSDMKPMVPFAVERMEQGQPVAQSVKQSASNYLYKKYKELTDMKSDPSRMMTRQQIASVQKQIEQDIRTLEGTAETKAQIDDQENVQGIPSEVGKGQEPVAAKPVEVPSEEAPTTGGVLQTQGEEVEKTRKEVYDQQYNDLVDGKVLDNEGDPVYEEDKGIAANGLVTLTDKKYGHGHVRTSGLNSLKVLENLLNGGNFSGMFGKIGQGEYSTWESGKFIIVSNNINPTKNGKLKLNETEIILNAGLTPFAQELANEYPDVVFKDFNGKKYDAELAALEAPKTEAAPKAEEKAAPAKTEEKPAPKTKEAPKEEPKAESDRRAARRKALQEEEAPVAETKTEEAPETKPQAETKKEPVTEPKTGKKPKYEIKTEVGNQSKKDGYIRKTTVLKDGKAIKEFTQKNYRNKDSDEQAREWLEKEAGPISYQRPYELFKQMFAYYDEVKDKYRYTSERYAYAAKKMVDEQGISKELADYLEDKIAYMGNGYVKSLKDFERYSDKLELTLDIDEIISREGTKEEPKKQKTEKTSEEDGERLNNFKKGDVVYRNYNGRYEEYTIKDDTKSIWKLVSPEGRVSDWNAGANEGFILKESTESVSKPATKEEKPSKKKNEIESKTWNASDVKSDLDAIKADEAYNTIGYPESFKQISVSKSMLSASSKVGDVVKVAEKDYVVIALDEKAGKKGIAALIEVDKEGNLLRNKDKKEKAKSDFERRAVSKEAEGESTSEETTQLEYEWDFVNEKIRQIEENGKPLSEFKIGDTVSFAREERLGWVSYIEGVVVGPDEDGNIEIERLPENPMSEVFPYSYIGNSSLVVLKPEGESAYTGEEKFNLAKPITPKKAPAESERRASRRQKMQEEGGTKISEAAPSVRRVGAVEASEGSNEDAGTESALEGVGLDETTLDEWKKKNKAPSKKGRIEEMTQAVRDLMSGKVKFKEYYEKAKQLMPSKLMDKVPTPASFKEIVGSIDKNKLKIGIINLNKFVKKGMKVGLRIDIPAFNNFGKNIVTVHDRTGSGQPVIGYGSTGSISNVKFKTSVSTAAKIGSGEQKSAFAMAEGEWMDESPESIQARAEEALNSPEWVQVSMNPARNSFFFDKADGNPVIAADEVLQVGNLVLAKNPQKIDLNTKEGMAQFEKQFSAKTKEGVTYQYRKGQPESDRRAARRAAMQPDIDKAIADIERGLSESGITVEVKDDADYNDDERIKGSQSVGSEGLFIADDGTIILNRDKLKTGLGKTIIFHEGVHPIINIIRNTDPKRYAQIIEGIKREAKRNPQMDAILKFATKEDYASEGEQRVEDELAAETFARIASGKLDVSKIDKSLRETIMSFINDALKMLGLPTIPLNAPDQEFRKAAQQISDLFNKGGKLSDIVGAENVQRYENNIAKESGTIETGSVVYAGQARISDEDENEIENPYRDSVDLPVRTLESLLQEYGDNVIVVNSDPTGLGTVRLPSGKVIQVDGGIGYMAIKENVDDGVGFAASSDARVKFLYKTANQMNEDGKLKNGKVLVLVMVQKADSMLGNNYTPDYVADALAKIPQDVISKQKLTALLVDPLKKETFKSMFYKEANIPKMDEYKYDKKKTEKENEKLEKKHIKEYKLKVAQIVADNKKKRNEGLAKVESIKKQIESIDPRSAHDEMVKIFHELSFVQAQKYFDTILGSYTNKTTKYNLEISRLLYQYAGADQRNLFQVLGEKSLVDQLLKDPKSWGYAVAAFVHNTAKQNQKLGGIKHNLFNAKFQGDERYILAKAHKVNDIMTDFNAEQVRKVEEGGKKGAVFAEQQASQGMYPSGKAVIPSTEGVELKSLQQTKGRFESAKIQAQPSFGGREDIQNAYLDAMDAVDDAVDAGTSPAEAVADNVTSQDWYKSLSSQDKAQVDKMINNEFGEEVIKAPKAATKPKAPTGVAASISSIVDNYYKIKDGDRAEKSAARDAINQILDSDPKLKYIYDNIRDINKQLQAAGVITSKTDGCP